MRTPKALNNAAQGKRHELREGRATLGYESNKSSVEANALQRPGTLPRPKQAAADFVLGDVPHQWMPLVSADHVITFLTPGGARFATANLRLPGATVFHAFGVPAASQSLADHAEKLRTTNPTREGFGLPTCWNREAVVCDSLGRKSQVFKDNETMGREAAACAGHRSNDSHRPSLRDSFTFFRIFSWDLLPRLSPVVAARLKDVGKPNPQTPA